MIGVGNSILDCAVRSVFGAEQRAIAIARQYGGVLLYAKDNLSNLFQNSNGTGAVTTNGDPIGLWLDQSFNGALGAGLVTNGNFTNGTAGWTLGAGWTVSAGRAQSNLGADLARFGIATIGKLFEITYTVTTLTTGAVRLYCGASGQVRTSVGTYTERVFASLDTYFAIQGLGTFIGSVDNISVREVLGYHATQATGANKPLLTTINGNFAISSNGTNQFMTITPPAITNACTITWAGMVNNLTASQKLLVGATDGLDITINTNGSITLSKVGGTAIGTTSTGVIVANTPCVITAILNAGTWTVRKNGVLISTFTDAQTFTATTYTLFATSAGLNPLNAITAEYFIDNQALPDADLLQIERFGAQRLGIMI